MKIAFLLDWHSENMGYSDNYLPRELARLGHEVHLISSNHQVYYCKANEDFYKRTLEPFLGPGLVGLGTKLIDGVFVHRLEAQEFRGKLFLVGLRKKLYEINPEIVQAGDLNSLITFQAAFLKNHLRFNLLAESHTHASVFAPARGGGRFRARLFWMIYKKTLGAYLNSKIIWCYPISADSKNICVNYFGIKDEKIRIRSLGVDDEIFKPISTDLEINNRNRLRKNLGILQNEIVCIYTGRLSQEKDPLLLAKAVSSLIAQGLAFRSLFIGGGTESYLKEIRLENGAILVPYMKSSELLQFYQASDIAVWPKQESTSQLDALGCGLPLVLGSNNQVPERVSGNGLLFEENSLLSLTENLKKLVDVSNRNIMGRISREKVINFFSWKRIALDYHHDYISLSESNN